MSGAGTHSDSRLVVSSLDSSTLMIVIFRFAVGTPLGLSESRNAPSRSAMPTTTAK